MPVTNNGNPLGEAVVTPLYAKTVGTFRDPALVYTDKAFTTTTTIEFVKSKASVAVMVGDETIGYKLVSIDDKGIIKATKQNDSTVIAYFTVIDASAPKIFIGSHETGTSIADGVLKLYSKQNQKQIEPKTGTIYSALTDSINMDLNIIHNISDFYGASGGDLAYVKGEIDPKTKGPGDRNWHPDEIEDSSAEDEGSSSSRS